MKAQAKYYMSLVMSVCTSHIRSCKGSGEPALSKRRDIDESSGQKLYLKRMFKEWRYAYAVRNKNMFAVPIWEEWQFYPCRKGNTIEQEMSQ